MRKPEETRILYQLQLMPLVKGTSEKAFSKNVKTEVKSGKPVKQAVAIAYAVKREAEESKEKDGKTVARMSNVYNKKLAGK